MNAGCDQEGGGDVNSNLVQVTKWTNKKLIQISTRTLKTKPLSEFINNCGACIIIIIIIFFFWNVEAVQQGLVVTETINEAFSRLFRIRMKLGMFDPPTKVSYNMLQNTSDVKKKKETNLWDLE